MVESFSQSFSSFRLPVEGHEEKPSAESGLTAKTNKPTNDTHRPTQKPREVWRHAHTRRAQTQTRGETRSDPDCCRTFTSQCAHGCAAVQQCGPRKACSAKQNKVSAAGRGARALAQETEHRASEKPKAMIAREQHRQKQRGCLSSCVRHNVEATTAEMGDEKLPHVCLVPRVE